MDNQKLFNKRLYAALRKVESEYHDLICMEDNETIHDLRVAIRRVTPLLDMYAKGLKDKKTAYKIKRANKIFKSYFRALSDIRDRQVIIERIIEMHPSSLTILDKLEDDIKALHRETLMKASGWDIPSLIDAVMNVLLEGPKNQLMIRKRTKAMVKKSETTVLKHLHAPISTAKDLHKLRIALKKFRYTLEISESLDLKYHISSAIIKAYQDELGYFQDLTVLIDYLENEMPELPILEEVQTLYEKTFKSLIEDTEDWSFIFGE